MIYKVTINFVLIFDETKEKNIYISAVINSEGAICF